MMSHIGYGTGSVAMNIVYGLMSFYLLKFYTDVFGITAASAGTMFFVARAWDAVNDPIMGVIVDKTKSRWGKFRPYILFGAIPMGLFAFLCFNTPDMSRVGKLVYAYVTYIGFGMIYTVIGVPYGALTSAMTQDLKAREKLTFFRSLGALFATLLIVILVIPLTETIGNGDLVVGYRITIGMLSILATLLMLTTFFTSREIIVACNEEEAPKFKESMIMVKKNKPLMILIIIFILTFAVNSITGAVGLYYLDYYLNRMDLYMIVSLMAMVPIILGQPLVLPLIKKFGKKKIMIACCALQGILMFVKFIIPPNATLFIVLSFLTGLSAAPFGTVIWAFVPDTIEYGEWKAGVRADGFVNAIIGFAFKLGMAGGGIIPGIVLTLTGYVPNVPQSSLALWGIRALIGLIPAVLMFISVIIFKYYDLTDDRYNEIVEELNKKKIESVA
ncbi:MFS transporter [Vallitalea okinawensis]|uniref:MFS transporter n=1 Tax=Vallitalea okinawensis TaxID=2078660 RepID=UPI000CFA9254|nr:MFS transporter [Vallitalea okinawensis]